MVDTSPRDVSASEGAAGQVSTKWTLIIALISSDILALILGCVWLAYGPSLFSYTAAEFYLFFVFVWLLGVAGIVFSEFRWGKGVKQRVWLGVGAALAHGLFLSCSSWWLDKAIGDAMRSAMGG